MGNRQLRHPKWSTFIRMPEAKNKLPGQRSTSVTRDASRHSLKCVQHLAAGQSHDLSHILQEFLRIGYYVNNDYPDEESRENPPDPPQIERWGPHRTAIQPGMKTELEGPHRMHAFAYMLLCL